MMKNNDMSYEDAYRLAGEYLKEEDEYQDRAFLTDKKIPKKPTISGGNKMQGLEFSKEAMAFKDGTVQMLNTSWDVEKDMRSKDRNAMEYVVISLKTDDVFSPVSSWSLMVPSGIPLWFDRVRTEKTIKNQVGRWARTHVFEDRRLPININRERDVVFVRNCHTVNLRGYKAHVIAAGKTTVNVKRAETSVSLVDREVRLNEYVIPNTIIVYPFFPSTDERLIDQSELPETSKNTPEPHETEVCIPNEANIQVQNKFEREAVPEVPEAFAGEDKREPVGIASWRGNQYEVFTNSEDYIACIKEEIDYRATSGFKFNTLINDPVILKSVDDIVYDFYGDENPNDIEYYKMKASDLSSEERIQSSPLMNEYKAYILAERSEEFCEDDELEG